jgi:hypothetical protein
MTPLLDMHTLQIQAKLDAAHECLLAMTNVRRTAA